MLDPMIKHFKRTNNRSMIARIYGLFTLKSKVFCPVDIMVMQNTCVLHDKENPTKTFDLKGSTYSRLTMNPKGVLKDTNFINMLGNQKLYNISPN